MITRIISGEKKSIDFFATNQLTSTQVHMQGYLKNENIHVSHDLLVAYFSLNGRRSHKRHQTLCRYPSPP